MDSEGVAYLSHSPDAEVLRFRPGSPGEPIGGIPDYFEQLEEDMQQVRGLQELMAAIRSLPPHTVTTGFHLLDHDRLVQQFYNESQWNLRPERVNALRIMDTDGRPLHDEPIYIGNMVLAGAADGALYRTILPTQDDGNPTLVRYRFTG